MIPVGLLNAGGEFTVAGFTTFTLTNSAIVYDVEKGSTNYVATGYSGTLSSPTNQVNRSSDGITWTLTTMPFTTAWGSIAYGNGTFVACSRPGNSSAGVNGAYSTDDGVTWTSVAIASGGGAESVIWDGTRFLAIEQNGANDKVCFSTNGTSWSRTANLSQQVGSGAQLAFLGTTYILLGWQVGSTTAGVCTSDPTSAANWSNATAPSTSLAYALGGLGVFVTGQANSATYYTSTNGTTWTTRTLPATATGVIGLANGFYWFKAVTTNTVYYSTDGINWTSTGFSAANPGRTYAWGGNAVNLVQLGTTTSDSTTNSGSYST